MEETLEYLEKLLSSLKARYSSGDKSVEAKLRAVAAKVDQLRIQADLQPQQNSANVLEKIKQKLENAVRRKSCCR